jgi:hypothetical protein
MSVGGFGEFEKFIDVFHRISVVGGTA